MFPLPRKFIVNVVPGNAHLPASKLALSQFTIKKRIKEIGIRKINGAKVAEILTMLNKDFIKWVGLAFIVTCPVAYYSMNK